MSKERSECETLPFDKFPEDRLTEKSDTKTERITDKPTDRHTDRQKTYTHSHTHTHTHTFTHTHALTFKISKESRVNFCSALTNGLTPRSGDVGVTWGCAKGVRE